MFVGQQTIGGNTYYFDKADGRMRTGLVFIEGGGYWEYYGSDGRYDATSGKWKASGTNIIRTALSANMRLNIAGGSVSNGAALQIATAAPNEAGASSQLFMFMYDKADGCYTIINQNSGKALEVPSGIAISGVSVRQNTPNGSDSQKWILVGSGNYVCLVPKLNKSLGLAVANASTANGTPVRLQSLDRASAAQKFSIEQLPTSTLGYKTVAHLQDIGDRSYASSVGADTPVTIGTVGESRRMEALTLTLNNTSTTTGSLRYQGHVAGIGDQGWRTAGELAGTRGQARQLEALTFELTGDLARSYDVYYRVHVSNRGWTGWASNGAWCGSKGLAFQMEAVEIMIVSKSSSTLSLFSSLPGVLFRS
jgi:hypothetical protein